MSPPEILETFGKSRYQIELEVATALFVRGEAVSEAFRQAREFVQYLENWPV
jgi:hypothetical protein